MPTNAVIPSRSRPKVKKRLGKRAGRNLSQPLRQAVQLTFLLLNLWIGIQFFLFVRYYETGGQSIRVGRPAGVEGLACRSPR